ncbi:hypothetical protein K1T71_014591 [Dendrolimus kikuchii]|uniref:Uncharacterized protein n=1 Tax=Dendrolimus kikuchii TaxID=765133 RepID=A0ACC1CEG4_9NEOP|nr:hypothetical protein K1T71_014591 [Dendrolimus kikuchii]
MLHLFPLTDTKIIIMLRAANIIGVAACIVLCAGLPIEQAPALKEEPAEVLFRVGSKPAVIECIPESQAKDIKYSWKKDGKELQLTPNIVQRKDEGTLTFLKPVAADEGIYQCFAESPAGVASTRHISFKRTYINHPQVKVKEHNPVDGRPFHLDCDIPDSYPKPTIQWKSQLIDNPDVSENILDRKITLSPDGTLWFAEVLPKDASKRYKYVCVAETPAEDEPVVLAEHIIKDLVKDTKNNDGELVPQYVSKDMVAKAGEVTMIYCIYGGKPLNPPDWFKDGKDTNGEDPKGRITRHNRTAGKRLLIKDTYLSDQGTFKCVVNNGVGKPQEHTMKLTVVSAPKYTKKPEKQIAAKEGQDVTIPCEVSGLPDPKITWTFNSKPLNNPRATVNAHGLAISKVQKSDHGYYGCQAVNEHGELYSETFLQV